MTNDFIKNLEKVSLIQMIVGLTISILYLIIYKNNSIFLGLLLSSITASIYTQMIKLGAYNNFFALYGFPVRLLILIPPCAILVHKFHLNLIALYIGFVLCQIIYFIVIFSYIREAASNKKKISNGKAMF